MDLPEEVKENIRIIFTSGYSLYSTLEYALDFNKIENGHRSLQLRPVELQNVVMDCMNVFQAGARIKGNASGITLNNLIW